jgi:CheY-like chemotaxis protein
LVHAMVEVCGQQDQASQPQTQATASPAGNSGKALNILVVEDNEDNQMLIHAYLMQTPHQLTLAENGAVAVERCKANTYDLVLMDVQMPVMDGYQATASIRQWEQTHQRLPTHIIALTANALAEDRQKSLAAGCNGHLTKPIKKAALLAAIEEVASGTMVSWDSMVVHVDAELKALIPQFLGNQQKALAAMQAALQQRDYETIRTLGHRMKGAAGGYGFDAVTDIGSAIEQAAKAVNHSEITTRLASLAHYLEHVEVVYDE